MNNLNIGIGFDRMYPKYAAIGSLVVTLIQNGDL